MDIHHILSRVDHTLLSPQAGAEEIRTLIDDAVSCRCASVCIPPVYVKMASEYSAGRMAVCTVTGFPLGYHSPEAKIREVEYAVADGADEIDTVIHIGALKDGRDDTVLDELKEIRKVTTGHILKVIIECCLLTEAEKIRMCRLVSESGADYIKTSTGFSTGGATVEDVSLMRKHCDGSVRIKAAGGISSFLMAQALIDAGADRLGSSRLVRQAITEDMI